MLGEDHSLIADFPEWADLIKGLAVSDNEFAEQNIRYTALDREIRDLELGNSPIDDEQMHRMKKERASLKDALYQRLAKENA